MCWASLPRPSSRNRLFEFLPPTLAFGNGRAIRAVSQTRRPRMEATTGPTISRADFTWCMTAIDWGWSIEATAARLMEESAKAQENGEHYALTAAQNAAAAVARRSGQAR